VSGHLQNARPFCVRLSLVQIHNLGNSAANMTCGSQGGSYKGENVELKVGLALFQQRSRVCGHGALLKMIV